MKKAEAYWPLTQTMFFLIIIFGAFVIIVVFSRFAVDSGFYLADCEGDIEADEIWSKSKVFLGYSSPRCTIYTDEATCKYSYEKVEINNEEITPCTWLDESLYPQIRKGDKEADLVALEKNCILVLGCAQLSESREPKCSTVVRCRPVSAIKKAIYSFKYALQPKT